MTPVSPPQPSSSPGAVDQLTTPITAVLAGSKAGEDEHQIYDSYCKSVACNRFDVLRMSEE